MPSSRCLRKTAGEDFSRQRSQAPRARRCSTKSTLRARTALSCPHLSANSSYSVNSSNLAVSSQGLVILLKSLSEAGGVDVRDRFDKLIRRIKSLTRQSVASMGWTSWPTNSICRELRPYSFSKDLRGRITRIAWSPEGDLLAAGFDNGFVGVWKPAENSLVTAVRHHNDTISDVAWSPDGQTLASASWDNRVYFTFVREGGTPTSWREGRNGVYSIQFSHRLRPACSRLEPQGSSCGI